MNGNRQALRFNTEKEAERVAGDYTDRTGHYTKVMGFGEGGSVLPSFWFIACGSLPHLVLTKDDAQDLIDNS